MQHHPVPNKDYELVPLYPVLSILAETCSEDIIGFDPSGNLPIVPTYFTNPNPKRDLHCFSIKVLSIRVVIR